MASSEHILIEGDEFVAEIDQSGHRKAQQHFHIVNRSHALQTEMILFEGGWLSVRQHRSRQAGVAQMINLNYVDPRPTVTRIFSRRSFAVCIALAVAALVTTVLALFSVQIAWTIPATLLLLTGAAVAFAAFAYRTRKDVVFHTRHGRAPVISLMGTLGSFRTLRAIVPKLVEAIERTAESEADPKKRLRNEMREHYRLRECGVLNETICAQSTQRILNFFE